MAPGNLKGMVHAGNKPFHFVGEAEEMMNNQETNKFQCVGCGALVPDVDGPNFRYPNAASPGCWAVFEKILAREYADFRYALTRRLSMDAYAVQHPGDPAPGTIQSVNVHLIALYLDLEKHLDPAYITLLMGRAVTQLREEFCWLDPPAERGNITVVNVLKAENGEEHNARVQEWALEAWQAWSSYHERIVKLSGQLFSG